MTDIPCGAAISSTLELVSELCIRDEGRGICRTMTPYLPTTDGCDIDTFIGVAPTGFSKESLGAALSGVEHKSKTLKSADDDRIVFPITDDVISVYVNSTSSLADANIIPYTNSTDSEREEYKSLDGKANC
jgi:hypothetical protein